MSTSAANTAPDLPQVQGVRHRFVTVRGVRIHLAQAGTETEPTVLLLHGFPQHWFAWRGTIAALANTRHVVAVDLPGFGWSGPSTHGYSTSERSRFVIALLDELGVDTADIVGHDWGAWLAFRVALDAPERVRRMVALSELHPWPLQRRLLPNLWRMWVTALFEMRGLGTFVQKRRRVVRWFLARDTREPGVWSDELIDVYAAKAAQPAIARAGQRLHSTFVVRDIARLLLRRDHRRRFETPTLLIAGDHDTYIPPRLVALPRRRRAMVRVQTITGGHFILDENPEGVAAAIGAHLLDERRTSVATMRSQTA